MFKGQSLSGLSFWAEQEGNNPCGLLAPKGGPPAAAPQHECCDAAFTHFCWEFFGVIANVFVIEK